MKVPRGSALVTSLRGQQHSFPHVISIHADFPASRRHARMMPAIVMPAINMRHQNPSCDLRGSLHDNLHRSSMEPSGDFHGKAQLHFPGTRRRNYLHVAFTATLTEAFMGTFKTPRNLPGNLDGNNHDTVMGTFP